MIMMSSDIMLFPYSQAQDIGLVERIRTFSSETLIWILAVSFTTSSVK